MITLILFLLVSAPQEGGTVVLNTRVPEAEFYLDANFVAATDTNGMLIVENLPAGSFTYSVVKRGYTTYKGSFSIPRSGIEALSDHGKESRNERSGYKERSGKLP